MASLSGIFQRPVIAASAVAIASISADFHDKLRPSSSSETCNSLQQSYPSVCESLQETSSSWVSQISVSKLMDLSFITKIRTPVPNVRISFPNTGPNCCSMVSSPVFLNLYQSAELAKTAKPLSFSYTLPPLSSDVSYRWHLPEPNSIDVSGVSDCSSAKSRTVVVLLGWLGAKQKHLKRYAEWYTTRGFHAITFTFPMNEILSYQVGGKAEQDIELLVNHLAEWLEEEHGKNLVFHTFSNTGWLAYGVILEKFQNKDITLAGRIKGCIVDSAPVAAPDPQVWASGFSAAFLKKHSVATKGFTSLSEAKAEATDGSRNVVEAKPALTEAALLLVLEKFFGLVLNYPSINRRLSDVLSVLTLQQPSCPQLYIYSSADKVIPAGSVESFIEKQRRSGREVRACNFISTPHVDHFRNDPKLYSSQLTNFLEDCVLTCC
ncbi:transmembrane protein 53-like [Olea europaea var. sylvestris]|uniref:transmembrane protein 53-like n=1 Tax=Olea europaea var. sylvestris TaxID=158386 RepID=UPI000C1D5D90|nr:transmembrane protein 53-like [Olea europaea var. sylvestris]XP_022882207.1 transmembrane protein 53-like [Olea europaea var. sylvestris]XP_022882208.1 transmembrane protein 53-like [Olea europaea var. sylvestris]